MNSATSPFRGTWSSVRFEWTAAARILKVAVPSAINTLQSNLTFLALTALVAQFGTSAIAGYGMSGRMEYLLIPVIFGIGSALVPMVSTNTAAGQMDRVRQATRFGLMLGASAGALAGLSVAMYPENWVNLFSSDPDVRTAGVAYLQIVGPAYIAFGGGLVLFFVTQGSGRVLPSLIAGFTRLIIAAVGGYVTTRIWGMGLSSLYVCMASGLIAYGLVMLVVARTELQFFRQPSPDETRAKSRWDVRPSHPISEPGA
jgi:Na+-driven multidrug efflux pump